MGSWCKSSFSKNTQKHFFCSFSLNISYKIHFFFGEKILVTLDTYAKTLDRFGGGGVHGKVCWLIVYYVYVVGSLLAMLLFTVICCP